MIAQASVRAAADKNLKRCPVLKIDFGGRFVYVDELSEELLAMPAENLFGRRIKEFLDESSYTVLLSLINCGRHYEIFFKAANFTFIDAGKNRHDYNVIISPNFIGGNPVNLQITVNPLDSRPQLASEGTAAGTIIRQLFDFVANVGNDVDWRQLTALLLMIEDVAQVGLFRYSNETLQILSSALNPSRSNESIVPDATPENLINVAIKRESSVRINVPDEVYPDENGNEMFADAAYPLLCNDNCWGVMRIIHKGDHSRMDTLLGDIANFLGNTLFPFICRESARNEVSGPSFT